MIVDKALLSSGESGSWRSPRAATVIGHAGLHEAHMDDRQQQQHRSNGLGCHVSWDAGVIRRLRTLGDCRDSQGVISVIRRLPWVWSGDYPGCEQGTTLGVSRRLPWV